MGNQNSGPKRAPNALQALRGVTRRDRLNPFEPKALGGVVMPDGLSEDMQAVWAWIAPVLLQMGTLTVADVPAFLELCALQVTSRKAQAEKARDGFSIFLQTSTVDSAGNEHQNVKIHPAIKLEGETANKLRPYYDYFGMTPSGRARLTVPKTDEAPASKWAGVLK